MSQTKRKKITRLELLAFAGRYGTIICLLGMIIVFSIFLPAFRSTTNLVNLMGQTAILSILAAGMTCCLKMGDFDLSIGAIAALTGIVVAKVLVNDGGIPLAILCGLLTGAAIGLMNGFFVAYVGLSAFVCTLATMSIVLGLGMTITKGISIWDLPEAFDFIGRGDLSGLPFRFILMMILLFILWFIHNYTPTGRRMEAIGGNAVSAQLSGIKVERNRVLGYLPVRDLCCHCRNCIGVVHHVRKSNPGGTLSAGRVWGGLHWRRDHPDRAIPYLGDLCGGSYRGGGRQRSGDAHGARLSYGLD